jgi:hypothetical protein
MTTEPLDLPEDVLALVAKRAPTFHEGTLVLLPVRLDESGIGHYADSQLTIPKDFRHFGIPTEFLQEVEDRTALIEFSEEIAFAVAFGVVANMTWDAAKSVVQYLYAKANQLTPSGVMPRVQCKIARVQRADGTVLEGVKVTGPADTATATELIRAVTGDTTATIDAPPEE